VTDLLDAQKLFSDGLFDVAAEPLALPLFKGDARLAEQRFALYRGNLSATWDKTLSAAYPVLKALVGDEFFGGLARAYGKSTPSQSGDLNRFGDRFAQFLHDFPHVAEYPYFPDMARLEWALHRAHYADNASVFDPAEIAQLAPEELERARLKLHPAVALIASQWAIVDLWQAHLPDAGHAFPSDMDHANHALIARPQWKTMVVPLQAGAYAVLHALQNGETLGAALDAALACDEEFDFASNLQQWLQHAVFASVELST
jgi:hypothetical protein